MEERTIDCPVCNTEGEFVLVDDEGNTDVIICPECGGFGFITKSRYEDWEKEMEQ